jgi:hypothetical protein
MIWLSEFEWTLLDRNLGGGSSPRGHPPLCGIRIEYLQKFVELTVRGHCRLCRFNDSWDMIWLSEMRLVSRCWKAKRAGQFGTQAGFPIDPLLEIQAVLGQNRLIRIQYTSGYKQETTQRTIEPIRPLFLRSPLTAELYRWRGCRFTRRSQINCPPTRP